MWASNASYFKEPSEKRPDKLKKGEGAKVSIRVRTLLPKELDTPEIIYCPGS